MLYAIANNEQLAMTGGRVGAYMLRIEMQSECYLLVGLAIFCCCKPFFLHRHERKDCLRGWWEGHYQQMTHDLRTALHTISGYLRSLCFPTANCRVLIKVAIK